MNRKHMHLSTLRRPSTISSPSHVSDPSWWDDISEAADLLKFQPPILNAQGLLSEKTRQVNPVTQSNETAGSTISSSSSPTECCVTSIASQDDLLSTTVHDNGAKETTLGSYQADVTATADSTSSGNDHKRNSHHSSSIPQCTSYSSSLDFLSSLSWDPQMNPIQNVCPSQVKILAAKLALNSGKKHVNKFGQLRNARVLKSACSSTCRRCEAPRLSECERVKIFQTFWSLHSHEAQWMYIFARVRQSVSKTRRTSPYHKNNSKCSRTYYLIVDGKERRVCKTMFKNTLCICDSWIDSAMTHLSSGEKIPDLRGKRKRYSDMSIQS